MPNEKLFKQLNTKWLSPESFHPYGQVIYASNDGKPYDLTDAQLVLQNGIPRFYIMRLHYKGYRFNTLTRHVQCTQCLGSLALKDWFIAVAPPTDNSSPILEEIAAFQIPGNCFIKLNVGTWHAGPYFDDEFADFYNLELSDTNINDYDIYNFRKNNNLELEIVRAKRLC